MPKDDNYNNFAMRSLNPDQEQGVGGDQAPLPGAGDDQQAEQGDQQSTITKVPGGFQVAVIVPTIEEAHALSQQFHAAGEKEDSPEAPPAEGDDAPPADDEDQDPGSERA